MKNHFEGWNDHFIQYRPFLISLAFRMTGSLAEAEDIVQETFLECAKTEASEIKNPKAWLVKVCSNKGIDHMKVAYKKREYYPGVWLPDEIPESLQIWHYLIAAETPEKKLIQCESLTTSFLLLIEKLTPEERAVYLLKEVFEYSFQEISEFLNKSEENCRKIAQRARQAIVSGQKKFDGSTVEVEKIVNQFFTALKNGDTDQVLEMLSPTAQLWGDGGGKISAAGYLEEMSRIASFFRGLSSSPVFTSEAYKAEYHRVNSRPGIVISKQMPNGLWALDTILNFEIDDGKIARIFAQRNPDKLAALTR